jgi:hypothetical protein
LKLKRARVQNYRSVHDTGWFDVEAAKTILVGPNEAGKSAVLRALQTVRMPPGEKAELDALRDYPRARFHEIDHTGVDYSEVPVASAIFALDDLDRAAVAEEAPHLADAQELHLFSYYEGGPKYNFGGVKMWGTYGEVEKPLAILKANLSKAGAEGRPAVEQLAKLTLPLRENSALRGTAAKQLDAWLDEATGSLDMADEKVDKAFDAARSLVRLNARTGAAWTALQEKIPFFVYFSSYYKLRPRIYLPRLVDQEKTGDYDEEYDFGNICLLKLLNLSAAELSELGRRDPDRDIHGRAKEASDEEIAEYQDSLDRRKYRLNGASIRLTEEVDAVWGEPRRLEIEPDGQYLRVLVQNEDGAKVELDQGSEGYRWLVSFYVVFQAQAKGDYQNAILLLDEPGVSLHALKQKQFRQTVSKIASKNQTLFSTHSPFMVGSDEMDMVRVVEMKDRKTGTVVHEDFAVDDPRSLYPLQAHFGYELGQTLFGQHRNLVVEGITDYWYIQGADEAARDAGVTGLDSKVTVIPAGDAGKVVYHATVLHAQDLKVAALFDSDSSGETAASNETLVHLLKKKQIIRVADIYQGPVEHPETEDLIRDTLIKIAKTEFGIDAAAAAASQPKHPVVDLLTSQGGQKLSKYKLGKAFIRWLRDHSWNELESHEREALGRLFTAANKGTS